MRYLYFTSEYCAPCRAIKSKILKHSQIIIIDVDKESKYMKKYDIMSLPTLLILSDDDKVQKQIIGTLIIKFLRENLKNDGSL